MIHVVNFATGDRFLRAQAIQNSIFEQYKQHLCEDIKIHSFDKKSYLDILDNHVFSCECNNEDKGTYDRFRELYKKYPRGQGLWSWKVILIDHIMKRVAKDDDIVLYVDSGACLKDIGVFNSFIKNIRQCGCSFIPVMCFEKADVVENWLKSIGKLPAGVKVDPTFPIKQWDTGIFLTDGLFVDPIGDMPQVCGGFQGYVNNVDNRFFVEKIIHSTWEDRLTGEEVRNKLAIDHRHDQSILSSLVNFRIMHGQFPKEVASGFSMEVGTTYAEAFCLHRGSL